MITAYASQPHYWRHLAPVVDELRARGEAVTTWAERAHQPWGDRPPRTTRTDDLILVAGWVDGRRWPRNPLVYLEHGAGQRYADGNGAGYAGAQGLSHVVTFLTPGEHVAQAWREAYPAATVETVGCPALDYRHGVKGAAMATAHDRGPFGRAPVVVVTSHWRCGVCPETAPALHLYEKALREVLEADKFDKRISVIGHCHPRAQREAQRFFDRLGVELDVDPDSVLGRADLLVADNTSLMYEAAAFDIPVLALNAPTYRRDVEHGLRFWSHVPGLTCNSPTEFRAELERALTDPPEAQVLRRRAAEHVYAHRGTAAARAADAVEKALWACR
jgi:hypothetical protein